jgi:tRNA modification GTPase
VRLDDTIAAIATAQQPSGLGVIRISGPQALAAAELIFRSSGAVALSEAPSHQFRHGWIADAEGWVDEVLAVVMREPRSFTTEDVVELHCHGSVLVQQTILGLLIEQGVRLAEPGEFTRRAFLKGRLDLTRVEAISDLIHARSKGGMRVAAQQLRGQLFEAISAVQEQLIQVASLVEASIEFPEEGETFTHREDCLRRIEDASCELERLLAHADQGRRLREGVATALIGRPNVGKSSLLNALLRESRAIVTAVPGTTRDLIEETVQLHGLAFRLTDTAGLRESFDEVESEGIRRTRNTWSAAELVVLVVDQNQPPDAEDQRLLAEADPARTLVAQNKADLPSGNEVQDAWQTVLQDFEAVRMSATTGEGLELLKARMVRWAMGGELPRAEEVWITNLRQQQAAQQALDALRQAQTTLEQDAGEEYLALDLRHALNALGAVVGETTADDLLARIFSEFCIGK